MIVFDAPVASTFPASKPIAVFETPEVRASNALPPIATVPSPVKAPPSLALVEPPKE